MEETAERKVERKMSIQQLVEELYQHQRGEASIQKVIKAKGFFRITKNDTKARTVGQNTDTSWLATAEQIS